MAAEQANSKVSRQLTRQYQDCYLKLGFSWAENASGPLPLCVVCGLRLANESMVPTKLIRHLRTKHKILEGKPLDYFKKLLRSHGKQVSTFKTKVTVSDKAQEASFIVAELVAKEMKPHTIAESLILPALQAVTRIMLGVEAENEIKKVPLSDSTISRRITAMSKDIEENVEEKLKNGGFFALQVDESTDISGKAQLLAFVRFVNDEDITENFFCCKELTETTKGVDVFNTMTSYLESLNLSWHLCVGVCTDGAPSMTGCLKGFVALVKEVNPSVASTHCFLHREALIAKTIGDDLKGVLETAVKMVNYIKQRPLKSRIFTKICESMESAHLCLILHTEVRWLSRGRVLSRFYELKDELLIFFTEEKMSQYSELLENDTWCSKLAYLADIFQLLNAVNTSMQGRNENILTSTDKIKGLQQKIGIWKKRVATKSLEMFPLVAKTNHETILPLISSHLEALQNRLNHYFPSLDIEKYDWIRNPFVETSADDNQFSLEEEEQLAEITNDRTLKLSFKEKNLNCFWIEMCHNYPKIGLKAIKVLLQFSTSYLCELGFSSLTNIKNKKRERLLTVEEEMRVCLSTVRPRIQELCKKSQSQVSH